jgi:hypothetical protein
VRLLFRDGHGRICLLDERRRARRFLRDERNLDRNAFPIAFNLELDRLTI